ncbi:MAG: hypothetical protein ABH843_01255 [Candidatus Omnitrophota bacterium]
MQPKSVFLKTTSLLVLICFLFNNIASAAPPDYDTLRTAAMVNTENAKLADGFIGRLTAQRLPLSPGVPKDTANFFTGEYHGIGPQGLIPKSSSAGKAKDELFQAASRLSSPLQFTYHDGPNNITVEIDLSRSSKIKPSYVYVITGEYQRHRITVDVQDKDLASPEVLADRIENALKGLVVAGNSRRKSKAGPIYADLWARSYKVSFIEALTEFSAKSSSAGVLDLDDLGTLESTNLKEDIKQAEEAQDLNLLDILKKSQLSGELIKTVKAQQKLIGEPAKTVKNEVIGINPDSIPEGTQRDLITKYLDKDSPQLQTIEEATGSIIRLTTQLDSIDLDGKDLIIISHVRLAKYEGARYLSVNKSRTSSELYSHMAPYIGIAKLLFSAREDNVDDIVNALNKNDFYRTIFGAPANTETERQIRSFLKDGGMFNLPVPRVNYEATEDQQKAGIAALMAA